MNIPLIATIEINYANKLTPAQLETLQKYCHEARFKNLSDCMPNSWASDYKEDDPKHNEAIAQKEYDKYLLDLPLTINTSHNAVVEITSFMQDNPTIKFSVIKTHNIKIEHNPIINNIKLSEYLLQLQDINKEIKHSLDSMPTFNEKCHVHIGSSIMLTINDVCYETDFCTDALQDMLNQGWRIIAACVQPDGRRPDYVFGRYNPEKETK